MQQSKELPWSVPIKRTAMENDKSKFDEGASQSKRTDGSISIKVMPETTKFEMTASEYHIKYNQIMTAGEGHFQKDCMGVSQLKEMPESITIKRSAKELYTYIREYQNQQ